MKLFWRYLLVVLLVAGMAVDPALARRLFQRKCRAKKSCPCVCLSEPAAACPAPCGEVLCDHPSEAPCHAFEAAAPEPCCQDCAASAPVEATAESFTSEELVEPAAPEPGMPMQESLVKQPSLPPAPVAAPELEETLEPIAPPMEETPATDLVGDRYSRESLHAPALDDEPQQITPPAEDPAIEDPAIEDPVDIFGDPTPETAEQPPMEDTLPAPEPPAPTDAETESSDAEPFGAEPTEPAPAETEPEPDDEFDDIFGAADSDPIEVEEEGEEESVDDPAPADSDEQPPAESYDPFGEISGTGVSTGDAVERHANCISVLQQVGGLQSASSRTWTDNTALYQCDARLLRVTTKQVLLQQDSGKKVVVPFERLADGDLHFVREQVAALRIAQSSSKTHEKLAVAWPTN